MSSRLISPTSIGQARLGRGTAGVMAWVAALAAFAVAGCGAPEPANPVAAAETPHSPPPATAPATGPVTSETQGQAQSQPEAGAPTKERLPVGRTTVVTTVHQGKPYHYNCYIPKSLKPDQSVIVVVNTSPMGDAEPLSIEMAEKLGWAMIGLVEARNGPGEPVYNNMVSAVQDFAYRYEIRDRGLIFSGFSGGARSSFFFAKRFGDLCGGIIAIGAGSYGTQGTLAPDIPVFFIAGETDFNRKECQKEAKREIKAGRVCKIEIHPGSHSWGPQELRDAALQWISEKMPPAGNQGLPH